MVPFIAAVLIAPVCGCDPDWPLAHSTCEVRGQVVLDGEPLDDAKVVFIPQRVKVKDEICKIASAITDNRGEFTLEVDSDNPKQIQHDRYRVLVSKLIDNQETLHRSYNRESVLVYEVETQEAFDRPAFELFKSGSL